MQKTATPKPLTMKPVKLVKSVEDVEMLNLEAPLTDSEITYEILEQIRLIEKAVSSREARLILRILRSLKITRRKLNGIELRIIAYNIYPRGDNLEGILSIIPSTKSRIIKTTIVAPESPPIAQVDAYFHLLLLLKLIDANDIKSAQLCTGELMEKISCQQCHTMNPIAAKSYYYYALVAELSNNLEGVRSFLMARYRTAALRNDLDSQAVLINCLLRSFITKAHYNQADKLVKKTVFPESATNNEVARYLYYLGRIEATKLEYTDASKHLVQAMRKAPQNTAIGFHQTAQKLYIVVELLIGNIPEHQIFRQNILRKPLLPYLQLTDAVRRGDLMRFGEVVENFADKFRQDFNYMLILRLRHNVIKIGLRKIAASYSRISTEDIAKKLMLDSAEDAEFIVAKAIRDGAIEGKLCAENHYLCTKETTDVYSTREPQIAFHERISFCLNLFNQSVRAMSYPSHSGDELSDDENGKESEKDEVRKKLTKVTKAGKQ